jgi:hypothetical protein
MFRMLLVLIPALCAPAGAAADVVRYTCETGTTNYHILLVDEAKDRISYNPQGHWYPQEEYWITPQFFSDDWLSWSYACSEDINQVIRPVCFESTPFSSVYWLDRKSSVLAVVSVDGKGLVLGSTKMNCRDKLP